MPDLPKFRVAPADKDGGTSRHRDIAAALPRIVPPKGEGRGVSLRPAGSHLSLPSPAGPAPPARSATITQGVRPTAHSAGPESATGPDMATEAARAVGSTDALASAAYRQMRVGDE